jgi:D-alanyl-D-alanine carboxypeptidase (penicillin-binding protein 5/6)
MGSSLCSSGLRLHEPMRSLRIIWLGLSLLPLVSISQTAPLVDQATSSTPPTASVSPGSEASPPPPSIDSESAIVMDSSSGKILWSRNADEELYPASTTKIMTALLLLERCKPDEIISAPEDVQTVKESSMHLKPGERVRARDMLYALLLRSANDGCYAVATHIAGSVAKFSDLMNKRAQEIGCTHTHFDNPNGLNDKLHYTSAHDLALMGREAMKYPAFQEIVRTEKTKINRSDDWKDLWMTNHNRILKRDPTCDGIKTGWTIPAGHCFVGSATREGWRVITVVMKSKSWENDTESLFGWAFANYGKQLEVRRGDPCGTARVNGGQTAEVTLLADQDAYSLARKGQSAPPSRRTLATPPTLDAPVAADKPVGNLVLVDQDGFVQKVPVRPSLPVLARPRIAAVVPNSSNGRFLIAAGLLVGAIYVRGRSRRRYHRIFGLRT